MPPGKPASKPPRLRAIVHTNDAVPDKGELVRLPPECCITLDFFRAGAPFLWEHGDESRGSKPIGRARALWLKPELIVAELEFDADDEFAMKLYGHYRSGSLTDFSIAWSASWGEPADGVRVARQWTLKEVSAVNKGRNAACRVLHCDPS